MDADIVIVCVSKDPNVRKAVVTLEPINVEGEATRTKKHDPRWGEQDGGIRRFNFDPPGLWKYGSKYVITLTVKDKTRTLTAKSTTMTIINPYDPDHSGGSGGSGGTVGSGSGEDSDFPAAIAWPDVDSGGGEPGSGN